MSRALRGLAIGAGYFSRFHLDAWRRVSGAELAGLVDLDLDKARAAADEFGVPISYDSVERALDDLRPDFVDIITPPDTHLTLVEQCAAFGVPVMCQKPLAPELSVARRIVESAETAGVRLMVHENFRFQPWHRELKRLIDSGAIGETLHSLTFRTRTGDGWGEDAYLARQPYFREMPRLLVHETGVHFIDTFRFLAGDVDEANVVLRRLNPVIAGEDAGLLVLRFASGALGVWDANRFNETTDENPRLTFGDFLIEGSGGSLRLYGDGRITLQPLGGKETPHEYDFSKNGFAGDCVHATLQHFTHCLLSGEEFETGGREYLKTLDVVEKVYESAAIGRPLPVAPSGSSRIVDLSRPIDPDMPGVAIDTAKTISDEGWNATTLTLYSHSGTHIDAPCHFVGGAAELDKLDLSVCVGPAKVIDLTPVEPAELITVERLGDWSERIGPGDRLLLRTDWHKRYPAPEFRNSLPRVSLELANWLVDRGVALLGVEPPSVADVNNIVELTDVHQTLFRGGVTIVEGLVNLDLLDAPIVDFTVLPLGVRGGDGSPARAIAVLH